MTKRIFLMSIVTAFFLLASHYSFATSTSVAIGVLDSRAIPNSLARTQHPTFRPTPRQGRTPIRTSNNMIRVQSGDTLSEIAVRYNVSLKRLMQINNLQGNKAHHIRVGQAIRLR